MIADTAADSQGTLRLMTSFTSRYLPMLWLDYGADTAYWQAADSMRGTFKEPLPLAFDINLYGDSAGNLLRSVKYSLEPEAKGYRRVACGIDFRPLPDTLYAQARYFRVEALADAYSNAYKFRAGYGMNSLDSAFAVVWNEYPGPMEGGAALRRANLVFGARFDHVPITLEIDESGGLPIHILPPP